MRFEMDEMRNTATSLNALGMGSGASSAMNTLSKTLGAELGKVRWGMVDEEDEISGDDLESETHTAVDVEDEEQTEGDDDDFIETIITKRKRVCDLSTLHVYLPIA